MSLKMVEPHTIDNAAFVSSTVPENDHAEYAGGTTYAADAEVIVIGTTHAIFKSVTGGNAGNDPVTDDGTYWVNIGSTNRWKAFDQYIGDPTTQANSVQWVTTFVGMTNSVSLFGLNAASVTVVMTVGGVDVYDQTHSLQDESAVVDAWSYFFSPIIRHSSFALTDLPPYANPTLTVTVTSTGETVSVGQLVIGLSEELGIALDDVGLGVDDYSKLTTDAFGRRSIVERDYAETMDVDFAYPSVKANYIRAKIASRRAKATVFAVDTESRENDLISYGFSPSLTPVVRIGVLSEANIEMRSLV
jgi:hypothetical protein